MYEDMRSAMLKLFAAVAFLFALAQPCVAGMAAVNLGVHKASAALTNVLTTNANDCPIGSLIVLQASYLTIADTLSSVADSAGNTWQTPIDNTTTTGLGLGWAYAKNTTVDLPGGATITATFAGSTISDVGALCVSNADKTAPLDTHNHTAVGSASTTATTVSTGTLSNTQEIVIGGLTKNVIEGITCNGGMTKITVNNQNPAINMCTLIVQSQASVSFTPNWPTPDTYVTSLLSFKSVPIYGSQAIIIGTNDNEPLRIAK
jgi:hypothetical protein